MTDRQTDRERYGQTYLGKEHHNEHSHAGERDTKAIRGTVDIEVISINEGDDYNCKEGDAAQVEGVGNLSGVIQDLDLCVCVGGGGGAGRGGGGRKGRREGRRDRGEQGRGREGRGRQGGKRGMEVKGKRKWGGGGGREREGGNGERGWYEVRKGKKREERPE